MDGCNRLWIHESFVSHKSKLSAESSGWLCFAEWFETYKALQHHCFPSESLRRKDNQYNRNIERNIGSQTVQKPNPAELLDGLLQLWDDNVG